MVTAAGRCRCPSGDNSTSYRLQGNVPAIRRYAGFEEPVSGTRTSGAAAAAVIAGDDGIRDGQRSNGFRSHDTGPPIRVDREAMGAVDWSVFLAVLLGLTVAIGVVVLLLEQPIRVERFGRTRILMVASLGLSTLAIFGIVIGEDRSSANTPSMALPSTGVSLDNVLRVVATSDQIRTIPANLIPPLSQVTTASNLGFPPTNTGCTYRSYEQSTVPPCIFGDRSGAHTWFSRRLPCRNVVPSVRRHRLPGPLAPILMFKPACPAAPLPTHPPIGAGSTADVWVACSSWHRFAINRINQTDPDLLIVTQNLNVTPQGTPYTPARGRGGNCCQERSVPAGPKGCPRISRLRSVPIAWPAMQTTSRLVW